MHDLKDIRDNPDAFDRSLARRGLNPCADEILTLDKELRAIIGLIQDAQTRRNAASKAIGAAKASGDAVGADRLMAEVEEIKARMPDWEAKQRDLEARLADRLAEIPNLPAADVPDGADEHGNVEVRRWGLPRPIEAPRDHVALGEDLGLMDFETAVRMSGARFVILSGALARLERAIACYMLDTHTGTFGYTEVSPPALVRDHALFGTGQLPKFREDLFATKGEHTLIPTAEVSLTNIVADRITDEEALPLRFTAWTPCFRSEAGSAGRDTRGMIRMHQFSKVELVSITAPDASGDEHERMTECAEAILKGLDLPFRTLVLCTGDMGFAARKTYDLEVWLPSEARYREISSCSNCGDFQARRMKARCKTRGEKGARFVHTLNGSGLAVGRTLVAILENFQNPDGSIAVPGVLRSYMGGLDRIGRP